MKYELNKSQIDTILRGLDALEEAAESENRYTEDADIHESNDDTIRAVNELREHLAPSTITSGGHVFEVVNHVPLGYHVWNIGRNMVDGYLPFCRLKQVQPFEGGREIETDTLKAIKCDGAQVILSAIGHGPETPKEMERFIEKAKTAEVGSYKWRAAEAMSEALPLMRQLGWEGDR